MGEITGISWTDHTFNPWIGCSKVHAGCTNCYAEADFDKRRHVAEWGVNGTRVVTSDANWAKPRTWNRKAEAEGVRRKVFCASLADVFEDRPELESWREGLFDLIDETPWLDWLLLTKRPENIRRMWPRRSDFEYVAEAGAMNDYPMYRRDNVWIGTSVSDQKTAEAMIPELLKCRDLSPVLFLSAEPLLGPISFRWAAWQPFGEVETNHLDGLRSLDWIIVGGESGPNARPCNMEWTRLIIDQCRESGVACFHKQLGAVPFTPHPGIEWKTFEPVYDDVLKLKDKKGGDIDEWPEDLRVRQFPDVSAVNGN